VYMWAVVLSSFRPLLSNAARSLFTLRNSKRPDVRDGIYPAGFEENKISDSPVLLLPANMYYILCQEAFRTRFPSKYFHDSCQYT